MYLPDGAPWLQELWNNSKQYVLCLLKTVSIATRCSQIQSFPLLRLVKVFEPLSYFTDALSGEKHATASVTRLLLKHMQEKILLVSPVDCTTIKEMKTDESNDLKTSA